MKTLTLPGNVGSEIRKLGRGICEMQRREEAKPAYVLVDAETLWVQYRHPTDLKTARQDLRTVAPQYRDGLMICRLERVE